MAKNAWEKYDAKELKQVFAYNEEYKAFLDGGKTERECIEEAVKAAEAAGFKSIEKIKKFTPGTKFYKVCMNKTIALFVMGKKSITEGMNILGAHIDSPRVDVKAYPLYENTELAYLDTHYYGGIKKWQWVTQPMSIHGVVCLKNGKTVKINIGEDEKDPVFTFTDLLIHLSAKNQEEKAANVIKAENLDLLVGNMPLEKSKLKKDDKDAVKANALALLKEKYGITEDDFMSSELEIVPSGKARDLGFDRSMVLAYGQDDRVCAFGSLKAILEADKPERTACCLLVDKEEIGSVGATGMKSYFFENAVAEVIKSLGFDPYLDLRKTMENSFMLSSDVSAGFDPLYAEAFEAKNAAKIGHGMCFNKYTGSRGKSGSNDASAEYIAKIRNIMDSSDVSYQLAELGKVDVGGGGTIAYILATFAMNVIDSGVAVLSMHAPYEVCSKADTYETYKGYKAFLKNA